MNRDSLSVEVNVFPAATKKANEVIRVMANNCEDELKYYFSSNHSSALRIQEDLQRSFYIMQDWVILQSLW